MTLINLFRRYERWNPVHPTYGGFWGIGFGLGCGVGWGPGFGPEVIGYVGCGCGVGISVGLTMVGIGVGLPAGGLASVPSEVVSYASHGIAGFTKSTAAPAARIAVRQGWSALSLRIGRILQQAALHSCKLNGNMELQILPVVALKDGWDCLTGMFLNSGLSHFHRCNIPRLKPDSSSSDCGSSSGRSETRT